MEKLKELNYIEEHIKNKNIEIKTLQNQINAIDEKAKKHVISSLKKQALKINREYIYDKLKIKGLLIILLAAIGLRFGLNPLGIIFQILSISVATLALSDISNLIDNKTIDSKEKVNIISKKELEEIFQNKEKLQKQIKQDKKEKLLLNIEQEKIVEELRIRPVVYTQTETKAKKRVKVK